MSSDPTRIALIMVAIEPFSRVANSDINAWMAAAQRTVPDVTPEEVAQAFEQMAEDKLAEAGMLEAYVDCRKEARKLAAQVREDIAKGEPPRDFLLMWAGGHCYQFVLKRGVVHPG